MALRMIYEAINDEAAKSEQGTDGNQAEMTWPLPVRRRGRFGARPLRHVFNVVVGGRIHTRLHSARYSPAQDYALSPRASTCRSTLATEQSCDFKTDMPLDGSVAIFKAVDGKSMVDPSPEMVSGSD